MESANEIDHQIISFHSSSTSSPATSTSILRDSPNYLKSQNHFFASTPPSVSTTKFGLWRRRVRLKDRLFQGISSFNGNNNSIWSPAAIDSPIASATACLDTRTWSQAAAVAAAATSPANCYQNYTGYYSNMDYLGPSVQQQLVSKFRALFNSLFNRLLFALA